MLGIAPKNTSSILDIVAMSTLIKSKLLKRISNINMDVISPSSLKLEACKLVYPPIDIGIKKPKLKYVNSDGNTCYAQDTLTFRNRLRDGVNEWQDENPSHYQD